MNLEDITEKLLKLRDPDSGYTMKDFENEMTPNVNVELFNKFQLGLINKSNNPNPEYATDGSSGFDIRAFVESPITIEPNEFKIIPTGLYFDIPENFEIQIRSRSGLSAKNGVAVLNSPGTIDNDFTQEVKIILINHGKEPFVVNNGDRIAQGVFASVISKNFVNFVKLDSIDKSTNRNGGFGSTGLK